MNNKEEEKILFDLCRQIPQKDYADDVIFDLGLKNKNDCRNWARINFYSSKVDDELTRGQKSSLTKKTGWLWNNISNSVYRQEIRGGKGIYKIFSSYVYKVGNSLGYLFAHDKETALTLARLFFTHIVKDQKEIYIRFIEKCKTPLHLIRYNQAIIKDFETELERNLKNQDETAARINELQLRVESIKNLQNNQIKIFKK